MRAGSLRQKRILKLFNLIVWFINFQHNKYILGEKYPPKILSVHVCCFGQCLNLYHCTVLYLCTFVLNQFPFRISVSCIPYISYSMQVVEFSVCTWLCKLCCMDSRVDKCHMGKWRYRNYFHMLVREKACFTASTAGTFVYI